MLRILPQSHPRNIEIGVEMIMASTMPGIPTMPQSLMKIRPICPAIAQRVIPTFNPMPARIGIRRLTIRKEFLTNRMMISLTR